MDGRAGVQSVDRALVILEELAKDDCGARLTELSRRIGLSVSTVHRLLTTLEQRRFVQFSRVDSTWHVGLKAFAVGSAFNRERNFVTPALPFLHRLRDQTRETVNLGIVENGEIVVMTQAPSREIARSASGIGGRTPMLASAMGKAILASYSTADLQAVVSHCGLRRFTRTTLTEFAPLENQLLDVRREGFAIDDEEYVVGLRCVAAPVYNEAGEAICAVSVSGLPVRLPSPRLPELGRMVARTASELTAAVGGRAWTH